MVSDLKVLKKDSIQALSQPLIYSYVLEQSVTTDSSVDIRLTFLVQVDYLCIATTFEVEYALIVPSVLIITNQLTFWIGRQCGLTCTRQTEEDSGVLTSHSSIGRAVHSSDTLQWEEVVHHREHTLLHFTTIPCSDDNLLLRTNVEQHSSL